MTAGDRPAAGASQSREPSRAAVAGQGLVDLGLILAIAVVVAVVSIVVFGAQLAAILDFIGAQVQQPA